MGSGGGGGARDQECCSLPGAGGNGGGVVMLFSPAITGWGGKISSCGGRGQNAGHSGNARVEEEQGGGGGGAGGSILLVTSPSGVPTDGSISIDVGGGAGGTETSPTYYAPGGKGGSGRFTWYTVPEYGTGPLSLY